MEVSVAGRNLQLQRLLGILGRLAVIRANREKLVKERMKIFGLGPTEEERRVKEVCKKIKTTKKRREKWRSLEPRSPTGRKYQEEMIAELNSELKGLKKEFKVMRGDYCADILSGKREKPSEIPDPQRRLQTLRALGGQVEWFREEVHIKGIAKLVKQEKAEGRPRSDEKTIRSDLKLAAEEERKAQREGRVGTTSPPG